MMDTQPTPAEAKVIAALLGLLPDGSSEALSDLLVRAHREAGWMSAGGKMMAGYMAMVLGAHQLGATGTVDEGTLLRLLSSPLPAPTPPKKKPRAPHVKSLIPKELQASTAAEFLRRTGSGESPEAVADDIHARLGIHYDAPA